MVRGLEHYIQAERCMVHTVIVVAIRLHELRW